MRPAGRQPWYYEFAEGYAYINLVLAAVAAALLLVVAVVAGDKDGWAAFLVAAGACG